MGEKTDRPEKVGRYESRHDFLQLMYLEGRSLRTKQRAAALFEAIATLDEARKTLYGYLNPGDASVHADACAIMGDILRDVVEGWDEIRPHMVFYVKRVAGEPSTGGGFREILLERAGICDKLEDVP
jgi:hypothetical protein